MQRSCAMDMERWPYRYRPLSPRGERAGVRGRISYRLAPGTQSTSSPPFTTRLATKSQSLSRLR